MPNLNKQTVIGHLGKDPEVRYMTNGDAVCNIAVAASEHWTDKNTGEKKEATEWIKCTIYRKLGELVGKEFRKGDAIHCDGKNKTRKWQDKDGNDRYTTELVVDYVARPVYVRKEAQKAAGGNFDGLDDDVPF